jgi:hypothetical protein
MSAVFGLFWILMLYSFKVGVFELSYKGSIVVAIVYASLMLFYFKKSRTVFLFSHAMVMTMILNFVFSFLVSLGLYALLGLYQDAFLSISIDVKIADILLNKDQYLRTVSQENLDLSIESLKTTKAFDVALDFFSKFSVVGLFYSLVLSLIFRKKNETNS